jgi:hypothetical protein
MFFTKQKMHAPNAHLFSAQRGCGAGRAAGQAFFQQSPRAARGFLDGSRPNKQLSLSVRRI